jgi:D-3-phosphoglycerate dehydrogenase / 2-oxoglutarate reductase
MMADRKCILVTCPPMLGAIDQFRPDFDAAGLDFYAANVVQIMSEGELVSLLPRFNGWIIGDDPATARVLEAGRSGNLEAVVKWGVGVDNVDFEAARRLGLPACNTPGVFGKEVADLAMHYVNGLARQTFLIDRMIRNGDGWPKPSGISLANKVVALIGFGDIGRNVALRLRAADMIVNVYDPFADPASCADVSFHPWPEKVGAADFLVFTAPLTSQTRHMFSHEILPLLKPGVRVVNVGRGPVIDESALETGLEAGIVHSAALDVFETEPLPLTSALRNHPLNIFGSHNGSNTMDAVTRVSRLAIALMSEQLGQ